MPTVLHVTNAGGYGRVQLGGAERAVAELGSLFAESYGWDVHVVAPSDYLDTAPLAEAVTRHPVPAGARLASSASRAIDEVRPDVAVTHLLRATLLAQPVAKAKRVRARVSVLHNSLTPAVRQRGLSRRLAYKLAFIGVTRACSHATVAVSSANRSDLVERQRIPARKVELIPGWVNESFLSEDVARSRDEARGSLGIDPSKDVVGIVGRLEAQKRQDFAISLLPRLSSCLLLLIGDGSLRARYEQEADALGVLDRVLFLGHRRDVERWMCACDAVAVPSEYEGFGRAAAEALALGIPVVANDVDGLGPLLRDAPAEGRWLVAPFDTARWTAALGEALRARDRPEVAASLRGFARERFSLDAAGRRYEELYESILSSTT